MIQGFLTTVHVSVSLDIPNPQKAKQNQDHVFLIISIQFAPNV
jgi:hypothetical protein